MNLALKEFKSVAITGKAERVPEGNEFNDVLDKLNQKSPGYKKYISDGGFKIWTIYKMTAKSLQVTDYSKSTRTVKEELPLKK
jgi:glycerol kinase